jgi:methylated-DNA-protein-cysteine methyltransferase related protein
MSEQADARNEIKITFLYFKPAIQLSINPIMAVRTKNTGGEKLKTVQPSGKGDSSFFEQVYQVVRQIPKGRVTSYGAIAECLGTKLSARMVGWAMNGTHYEGSDIPAHRVVNRNGMLTGRHHFATPDEMQELLEKEGVKVEDNTITNFEKVFWNPAEILL